MLLEPLELLHDPLGISDRGGAAEQQSRECRDLAGIDCGGFTQVSAGGEGVGELEPGAPSPGRVLAGQEEPKGGLGFRRPAGGEAEDADGVEGFGIRGEGGPSDRLEDPGRPVEIALGHARECRRPGILRCGRCDAEDGQAQQREKRRDAARDRHERAPRDRREGMDTRRTWTRNSVAGLGGAGAARPKPRRRSRTQGRPGVSLPSRRPLPTGGSTPPGRTTTAPPSPRAGGCRRT